MQRTHRIDALINLSHEVYVAIDQMTDGERRAERIVRLGIATAAQVIEQPYGIRLAGDRYHRLLQDELVAGGLSPDNSVYGHFPDYQGVASRLPRRRFVTINDPQLDTLARRYAAVERLTVDRMGQRETNASHVAHLSSLGLAYAAQYYPELDQSRIALYSLLHDLLEAYAGDTPSLGASEATMAQKERDEAAAFDRIRHEFGATYPTLIGALHTYEQLADEEACFVKTFDKLDPGFTHHYSQGITLTRDLGFDTEATFRRNVEHMTLRMARGGYARAFPDLLMDREILTDYIAATTPWPN